MLRHIILSHPKEDCHNKDYSWEPINFFQKPLDGHVVEALAIKETYGCSKVLVLSKTGVS